MKENKKRFQYPTEMKIEKFEYPNSNKIAQIKGFIWQF